MGRGGRVGDGSLYVEIPAWSGDCCQPYHSVSHAVPGFIEKPKIFIGAG